MQADLCVEASVVYMEVQASQGYSETPPQKPKIEKKKEYT